MQGIDGFNCPSGTVVIGPHQAAGLDMTFIIQSFPPALVCEAELDVDSDATNLARIRLRSQLPAIQALQTSPVPTSMFFTVQGGR